MPTSVERPLEVVLESLGQRGVYTLMSSLLSGPMRFGALQQLTMLPPRTLSIRLKELEEMELISRTEYNEVPPRVDYALTDLGKSLKPSLDALAKWEEKARR
jgi:DNA-binding HxlR family transcriptional regulator